MTKTEILKKLPYTPPFLFVDRVIALDDHSCSGEYTFRSDLPFYLGHFKGYPVTPGAILTECCAQIGLVCLGIHLLSGQELGQLNIGMTDSQMEFYIPVFPNEKVLVTSEKVYFRFNKLKCNVKMFNDDQKLVCKGTIAGMINSLS